MAEKTYTKYSFSSFGKANVNPKTFSTPEQAKSGWDKYSGGGGGGGTSSAPPKQYESTAADLQRQKANEEANRLAELQKLGEQSGVVKRNIKESDASLKARQVSYGRAVSNVLNSNQFNQRPQESYKAYNKRLQRAGLGINETQSPSLGKNSFYITEEYPKGSYAIQGSSVSQQELNRDIISFPSATRTGGEPKYKGDKFVLNPNYFIKNPSDSTLGIGTGKKDNLGIKEFSRGTRTGGEPPPTGTRNNLVVEPAKLTGLNKFVAFQSGKKSSPLGDLALGAGISVLGTANFIKSTPSLVGGLFTGSTIEKGIVGIGSLPKTISTGAKSLGKTLRNKPGVVLGFIGAEALTLKGSSLFAKGVVKTSDYFRTFNTRVLPVVKPEDVSFIRKGRDVFFEREPTGKFKKQKFEIVEPKYFEGQRYPKLDVGQTAGELKAEFKPLLPGEKKPAFYTASPKPVKGEVLGGSSELKGLYGAGRLSPTFMGIAGEKSRKLFSFRMFDTLRPTATRTTPISIKLAKGVKESQSSLNPLTNKLKQFFSKEAPPGEFTIPFIKTEKEGILSMGSNVKLKPQRFSFEFENRKIPILESEFTNEPIKQPSINLKVKTKKEPTIETLQDFSSRSRNVKLRGKFTPLEAFNSLRIYKKSSSSLKSIPSSFSSSSSSGRSSSLFSSSKSLRLSPRSSSGVSSSRGLFPSSSLNIFSSGTSSSRRSYPTPKKYKPTSDFGFRKSIFKTTKTKSKAPSRTPSLFALGRGIKSSGFGNLESSGLTIRPIIVSSRKKKKVKGGKKK